MLFINLTGFGKYIKKYEFRSTGLAILFGLVFVEIISPLLISSYAMVFLILSVAQTTFLYKQ